MNERKEPVTRRTMLTYSLGTTVALAAASSGRVSLAGPKKDTRKAAKFYQANGAFDPQAAKDAYYAMMKRFGYPISDVLKTDQFWVCDFLQRVFAKLGMAGIFWINSSGTYGKAGVQAYAGNFKDDRYGYLGHEIYLLPGQMLPEHRHVGGNEGYGPKMESWQVRYGSVEFFGEHKGAGDETLISEMPPQDLPWGYGQDWFKSKYIVLRTAKSGKLYTMGDPESWHGQRAGPEGAIVTEYGTYHNQVEFSKPDIKFASSEAI
jgi:D-lyxose ketol-isomerase